MTDVVVMVLWPGQMGNLLAPPAGVTITAAASEDEAIGLGANARALLIYPQFLTQRLIDNLPRLEWIQLVSAGTDILDTVTLRPGIVVTNASGMHGPQMSELAFLYMLAFCRDMRGIFAAQAEARWNQGPQRLLAGQKVLIVGVGASAEALAARCNAFEMHVEGVSGARNSAPGFRHVHPMRDLHKAVGDADFIVVLTPWRKETRHLINGDVLAAMRSDAFLINLARGPVVDENALIAALRNGEIAGAGLDVFETEPLPPESPLWRMRNVIVTPHIGGYSDIYREQLAPLVNDNLWRWFDHPRQPPRNQVWGSPAARASSSTATD